MAGKADEFERVALCHSRSLLRVALRLTGRASAAEDLVQECLLLAWKNFHQFQPDTNARAWLFKILFNAFYAEGRRLRRVMDAGPPDPDLRSVAPRFDEAVIVAQALDSLHPEHRAVLLLGVVEGFTCREIGGILSVPVGTVMSRLSRARQAMRSKLALEYSVKETR